MRVKGVEHGKPGSGRAVELFETSGRIEAWFAGRKVVGLPDYAEPVAVLTVGGNLIAVTNRMPAGDRLEVWRMELNAEDAWHAGRLWRWEPLAVELPDLELPDEAAVLEHLPAAVEDGAEEILAELAEVVDELAADESIATELARSLLGAFLGKLAEGVRELDDQTDLRLAVRGDREAVEPARSKTPTTTTTPPTIAPSTKPASDP